MRFSFKDLTPRSDRTCVQIIDLRELGFIGRVSDEALEEIEVMERRQAWLMANDRTVFD